MNTMKVINYLIHRILEKAIAIRDSFPTKPDDDVSLINKNKASDIISLCRMILEEE